MQVRGRPSTREVLHSNGRCWNRSACSARVVLIHKLARATNLRRRSIPPSLRRCRLQSFILRLEICVRSFLEYSINTSFLFLYPECRSNSTRIQPATCMPVRWESEFRTQAMRKSRGWLGNYRSVGVVHMSFAHATQRASGWVVWDLPWWGRCWAHCHRMPPNNMLPRGPRAAGVAGHAAR